MAASPTVTASDRSIRPVTPCGAVPTPLVGRAARLGALFLSIAILLELGGAILSWAGLGFSAVPLSLVSGPIVIVGEIVLALVYTAMGALLATRRPCSLVGWLFLSVALVDCTTILATMLVAQAHEAFRPVPAPTLALAWLTSSFSLPIMAALMDIVLVVFPDGRPVSRRWAGAAGLGLVAGLLVGAGTGFDRRGLLWFPSLPNPLGDSALAGVTTELRLVGVVLGIIAVTLAVGSSVARYRRGDALLRAQLRWIVLSAMLVAGSMIVFLVIRYEVAAPGLGDAAAVAALVTGSIIPVASAFAILRHHLYGIQVLLDRTLVYLPLMALLGGFYAASVTLFQRLFVAFTGDTSDAAVILSSLLLAGAFTPARRILEGQVERRFHASTGDARDSAPSPAPASGSAATPGLGGRPSEAYLRSLERRVRRLEREVERAAHRPLSAAAGRPRSATERSAHTTPATPGPAPRAPTGHRAAPVGAAG